MLRDSSSVKDGVDLTTANTLGVQSLAREAFLLDHENQLPDALAWFRQHPGAFVLGGGSNVLLVDNSAPPVLLVRLRGRKISHPATSPTDPVLVSAAAGENWHEFVQWTLAQQLYGLENLSLIPGLCGAAPVQNIGAYGVEISNRVHRVHARNLRDGSSHNFSADDCQFGYRDSVFKRQPGQWLITRIELALSRQPQVILDYGDIGDELAAHAIKHPTPADVAQAVCHIRRRKLPDPAVLGNAGSFFKNPVLSAAETAVLKARSKDSLAGIAQWPGPNGVVKLAAAALIEACELKGYRNGDAGVHEHHALVLVNHGSATGQQIEALASHIQEQVNTRFGVWLEPEPVFIRSA
ncbi:MAG: UDP-N-acetylmuramate dehydrogenase [Burkholderiaceae bacterium]